VDLRPGNQAGNRPPWLVRVDQQWLSFAKDGRFVHHDLVTFHVEVEHDVKQYLFQNRPQAARTSLAGSALRAMASGRSRTSEVHAPIPTSRVLLDEAFFGSVRSWIKAFSSSSSSVAHHRQAPDEFWNEPYFDQVFRLDGLRIWPECP